MRKPAAPLKESEVAVLRDLCQQIASLPPSPIDGRTDIKRNRHVRIGAAARLKLMGMHPKKAERLVEDPWQTLKKDAERTRIETIGSSSPI